ncbi:hypothetical protein G7Z17_g11018 [Cylindrodendrum hubeiense]|uniref:Uncharacterized protein n=1 Tax=Cylindrodendrum hubeiense TaxID=595255 RepID=A0A9P5H4S8_9HYPO|nr:hypothetical protein G7Z17_g11018 [Cylindrodendrum hubeiense]
MTETGDISNSEPTDTFALVSGFYGPGSLAAWYLMNLMIVYSWRFDRQSRGRISINFLAALLYPLVAAGHFLIQIQNFPDDKEQQLIQYLYNFDNVEKQCLDLHVDRDKSVEQEDTYLRILAIATALKVVDVFYCWGTWLFIYLFVYCRNRRGTTAGRQAWPATVVTGAGFFSYNF